MDNNNGKKGEGTIRARNKTVMLSPELAGQVRAKMASELAKNKPAVAVENQGGLHRPAVKSSVQEAPVVQRSGSVSRPEAPTSVRRPSAPPSSAAVITPPAGRPREVEPVKPYQQEVVYRDEPVRVQEQESPEPSVHEYDLQVEEVQEEHIKMEAVRTDPASLKVIYTKKTKVIGFLVSYDHDSEGEFVVLRLGRLMVTSDAGSAQDGSTGQWNMLVIPDETVSGMHAIMKVQVGELHVLDQLSEHGTRIVKAGTTEVEELSQARGIAAHGDKIQFGKRTFLVCMVPQ